MAFDTQLYADIHENIIENHELLREFDHSTVFITGATGLIGSILAKTLLMANRECGYGIYVIASVRNIEKAKQCYADFSDDEYLSYNVSDVQGMITCSSDIDHIVHCASVTASKEMIIYPVETIKTSINGTLNILEFARSIKVKSIVYISSMEVYGKFEESYLVDENMYGVIDPLKVRSNYPESKRVCENICIAYKQEYLLPIKIVRLAQIFGAGVAKDDNRVYAQFARAVIHNADIILHTDGHSEGNYCYTKDAMMGILTVLLKGKNGEAYNVANEDSHSTILEMANLVADKVADGKINVKIDIPKKDMYGYAEHTKMKIDSSKLQRLGWKPKVRLEESYIRMIKDMVKNEQ